MLRRIVLLLVVGVTFAFLADLVCAEDASSATVSTSAKARLQVNPSKLRVQIELRCYGGTIEAALKNLKIRREAAAAQLKKLNADATSISFSIPRAGTPQAVMPNATATYTVVGPGYAAASSYAPTVPPPAAYAPSVATPLTPPPLASDPTPTVQPPEPPSTPPATVPAKPRSTLFVATTVLRAEWPLRGADADAVIAAAEAIRQKALAADLTGSKAARDRLSPEEQELAEEADMRTVVPVDPSGPMPVPMPPQVRPQPTFVYGAVLSDKQYKAMLAEACATASRDAAAIAEAAGLKLGLITSLQCNFDGQRGVYTSVGPDSAPSPLTSHDNRELLSATPDGLEFECQVYMSHRIAPAGGKP
jgi:uncharacterized protein YggE